MSFWTKILVPLPLSGMAPIPLLKLLVGPQKAAYKAGRHYPRRCCVLELQDCGAVQALRTELQSTCLTLLTSCARSVPPALTGCGSGTLRRLAKCDRMNKRPVQDPHREAIASHLVLCRLTWPVTATWELFTGAQAPLATNFGTAMQCAT